MESLTAIEYALERNECRPVNQETYTLQFWRPDEGLKRGRGTYRGKAAGTQGRKFEFTLLTAPLQVGFNA